MIKQETKKHFQILCKGQNPYTEVTNKSCGNILLASKLFGNSPEIAKKHYYTGLDLEEAKRVLES